MEGSTLQERVEIVQRRISSACERCGRKAESVTLIAVTKTHPVETIQQLIEIGVKNIGENRVQEIVEKVPYLKGDFKIHLIGHLQTNKVAKVIPFVDMIQSIDRERVIEYLEKYLPEDRKLPVLIEVNTTGEPTKSGCTPEECRKLSERCLKGGRLIPNGYMTLGPLGGSEVECRRSFSLLRELAEKNRDLIKEPHLSMGMSDDFEWAIEEGATMVRIGTLLLGKRNS